MSEESNYDGFKWIRVKKYSDDASLTWEERYRRLEKHHVEETTFLINEIRRLARKFDLLEKPEQA